MGKRLTTSELAKYIKGLNGKAEAFIDLGENRDVGFKSNIGSRKVGVSGGSPVYRTNSGNMARIMPGDVLQFANGEEVEVV